MDLIFKELFISASRMKTLPHKATAARAKKAGELAGENGLSVENCHYQYFEDAALSAAWHEGFEKTYSPESNKR